MRRPRSSRAIRSALSASRRKSSSRSRLCSSWSRRIEKPSVPSMLWIARTASRSVPRSARSALRTSGRWTLIATSRPSKSVARCTCASDAEAIGRRQILAKSASGSAPSSAHRTPTHVRVGQRARAVLKARQPLDVRGRQNVGARGQELPGLEQHAAEVGRGVVQRRRREAVPLAASDADDAAQDAAVEPVQALVADVDARDRAARARRAAQAFTRAELDFRRRRRHHSFGGSSGQLQDPSRPRSASFAASSRSSAVGSRFAATSGASHGSVAASDSPASAPTASSSSSSSGSEPANS